MDADVLKVLETARALIEKGWTQRVAAADKHGRQVDVISEKATCFCTVGAIHRASADLDLPSSSATLAKRVLRQSFSRIIVVNHVIDDGLIIFNDAPGRKKEEVLSLFDAGIATLTQGEEA